MSLRHAAIVAMRGRKWYEGAVSVHVCCFGPKMGGSVWMLWPYIGGILDTLGGSHGFTFVYLPIVYLDDCQVVSCGGICDYDPSDHYEVDVEFLSQEREQQIRHVRADQASRTRVKLSRAGLSWP